MITVRQNASQCDTATTNTEASFCAGFHEIGQPIHVSRFGVGSSVVVDVHVVVLIVVPTVPGRRREYARVVDCVAIAALDKGESLGVDSAARFRALLAVRITSPAGAVGAVTVEVTEAATTGTMASGWGSGVDWAA